MGYGDIHPVAGVTKALVGVEIIFGVGWTVIVFGAVIAYLVGQHSSIDGYQAISGASLPLACAAAQAKLSSNRAVTVY